MGITHTTAAVAALDRTGTPYQAKFLVDTGAMDCLAPAGSLREAGIMPEGRDIYELANGEIVEYPYGYARMTFIGTEIITKIIFGPEQAEPILGVMALEHAGISVDPATQTLKRMAARYLKKVA